MFRIGAWTTSQSYKRRKIFTYRYCIKYVIDSKNRWNVFTHEQVELITIFPDQSCAIKGLFALGWLPYICYGQSSLACKRKEQGF